MNFMAEMKESRMITGFDFIPEKTTNFTRVNWSLSFVWTETSTSVANATPVVSPSKLKGQSPIFVECCVAIFL